MQQYQCLLVANECYQRGRMMTPTKIVVHSTAANNTSISRYVQPAPGQTAGLMQYLPSERKLTAAETKAVLGENRYGNDWNREGLYVCVHAFLGKLADGSLAVCQTLPWKMRCWGVGSGRKGSYNDCSIQFEICEDDHSDAAYCRDTFELAAELCAHLMRAYPTITEIVSHNEAGQRGYGSDHNDPDNWWSRHGYTMGMLRRRVAELPENGMVWMCFGSGDSTELYTGTVTIQDAGIAVNDMLVITNGTVNPLNQVSWVSDGLAVYGLSTSDYRGVYMVTGG